MSGAVALAGAFAAGVGLGVVYFGTLWLVVRRLGRLGRPAVWLGVTGVLRLIVVVALFYLLVREQWERLAVALFGFLAARVALTRWVGRPAAGARSAAGARRVTGGRT